MKTLLIIIAFVITVVLNNNLLAQTADPPSGSGTSESPYLIATLNNLYWITQNTSSWASGKYFRQTADINASSTSGWNGGAGFTPIGNYSTKFYGNYDGDEYTISGLYISRSGTNYVGLFGYTNGATIQDLGVVNVNITGQWGTGGLVGYLNYSSIVNNCFVTGTVTSNYGEVGGLVGNSYNSSTVSNCYSQGSVSGSSYAVGGLVGYQDGSTVEYSYSTSSANAGSNQQAAGLVGSSRNSSVVSNCYSSGAVTGGVYSGGLVGVNISSTVSKCYSVGDVTGISSGRSGLVGQNYSPSIVSDSFWDIETSGTTTGIAYGSTTGATGKTTAEMKTQSTFTNAGWSSSIWYMDAGADFNDGYPYLHWENPGGTPLPVALSSFTASVNKNDVTLNWTTAYEINNAGFDIERQSLAGRKDIWTLIGFVEGNGTTNEPKNYSYKDRKLNTGEYNYRLVQRDHNNRSVEHFLSDVISVGVPNKYKLSQNYPNPFNPKTKISFELPNNSEVNIKIFDVLGREVVTLLNGFKEAGYHTVEFDGSNLSSGMYFYRISTDRYEAVKRMLLVK